MAAQLKEIVDRHLSCNGVQSQLVDSSRVEHGFTRRLNAAPFNCDLSLVGFDEKAGQTRMQVYVSVRFHI